MSLDTRYCSLKRKKGNFTNLHIIGKNISYANKKNNDEIKKITMYSYIIDILIYGTTTFVIINDEHWNK